MRRSHRWVELKGAGWGPRTTPNVEGGSTAIQLLVNLY